MLDLGPAVKEIRALIRQLVQRAQEAGVLRGDIEWRDVAVVLASVFPPVQTLGVNNSDGQWRRNVDIVLAGLRA